MDEKILLNSLKENSSECIIKNRRKRSDSLLTIINIFNYSIWAFLLVIMALCENAGIKLSNFNHITLDDMNLSFVQVAIKLSFCLFIASFVLIFLSFKRCRRRTDKIKAPIFIGEIFSFSIWVFLVMKLYF